MGRADALGWGMTQKLDDCENWTCGGAAEGGGRAHKSGDQQQQQRRQRQREQNKASSSSETKAMPKAARGGKGKEMTRGMGRLDRPALSLARWPSAVATHAAIFILLIV